MGLHDLFENLKGGSGSGNFGHSGVKGKRGGSAPGGGKSGGGLVFEVQAPRSMAEHSSNSFMKNALAKDLSKKLGGKSSPDSAGSHQSSLKTTSFATKKSHSEVELALQEEGFKKGNDGSYYQLDSKFKRGVKAEISTIQHKSGFWSEPEPWTQVELSTVVEKE